MTRDDLEAWLASPITAALRDYYLQASVDAGQRQAERGALSYIDEPLKYWRFQLGDELQERTYDNVAAEHHDIDELADALDITLDEEEEDSDEG